MVTHITSPPLSDASFPSSAYPPPPPYAASVASASTAANQRRESRDYRPPPSSRHHRAASSASSARSQSSAYTVVPPSPSTVITTPSLTSASYRAPPPSYQQLRSGASVASTSARHASQRRSSRTSYTSHERAPQEVPQEIQNAFPWFGLTGDVEVCIKDRRGRREKRYLLHRLYLAQNSTFWEEELADEVDAQGISLRGRLSTQGEVNTTESRPTSRDRAPANSSTSGSTGRRIWRYELDWGSEENSTPVLIQAGSNSRTFNSSPPRPPTAARNKPPPPTSSNFFPRSSNSSTASLSRPQSSSNSDHQSAANNGSISSADEDLLVAYDNLFRIFYNHSPVLCTTDLASAYVECKALLSLALQYTSLPAVGQRIDHHLLRFGSALYKQIARYPHSYLRLGHMARSRTIFSEALIHVVGAWPAAQAQLRRGTIDDSLVDLIEDKVMELEDGRIRCEAKLLRLTLNTSRGERVNPINAWNDWLCVSLFRQWVAENVTPAPTGILKQSATGHSQQQTLRPAYGRVFRLLAQGGEAYLSHDELKRFLKNVPGGGYSRDSLKKFERRMDELKNLARDVAKPMTRSFLELDPGRDGQGVSYLTCTKLDVVDIERIWEDAL